MPPAGKPRFWDTRTLARPARWSEKAAREAQRLADGDTELKAACLRGNAGAAAARFDRLSRLYFEDAADVSDVSLLADAAAATAGRLSAGMITSPPANQAGSISRANRRSAICPSYSSPWVPAVNSTVGPSPPRTTTIGTRIAW